MLKEHVDLGKPQKKFFFSGPTTKAFTPPPLGLVVVRNFFSHGHK